MSDIPFAQLASRIDGALHTASTLRRLYATDASEYQELPAGVVLPESEDDIREIIRFARRNQLGLIPRAAGTSLAGQCVGSGLVVDISKHFTEILSVDEEARRVRVQPGVVRDDLNRSLAPEAVMKLYHDWQRGDLEEAKRVQFKILEVIETMFAAGNFPEGFREGVNLRGFNAGRARQPMAPGEMEHFLNIRSKLACLLGDCGFDEAAAHCQRTDHDTPPALNERIERIDVETIVREVVGKLHPGQ